MTQLTVTATRPDFALRGSPQAYIDVSIANLCGTYFRRLAELRRNDPLHVHHSSLQTGGEDALERIAVALEVRRLLRLIGENCQQLLRGKYLIGLSLQEMADAIGVHEPTVRARLHECRKRLRDLWLN